MTYDLRVLEPRADPDAELLWRQAPGPEAPGPSAEAPLPPETGRLVALRRGAPVARVGFGAREGFSGAPGLTGFVGWYAAAEAQAGAGVLREAAQRLIADGAMRVIGPLDGSTWQRYRVALARQQPIQDGEPFLSEPRNPPQWADHFRIAGFHPLMDYETRRVSQPTPAAALQPRRAELERGGIRLRSLSLAHYDRELRGLYDLSVRAFARNPFYTPIEFDLFRRLYLPLAPLLEPELVRLAEDPAGRLIGYVVAFPDTRPAADRPRIVLKTLAVDEEFRGAGLGAILVDEIHARAAERGASVLHALMQVTNASRDISRRSSSEEFRRYRLYGYGPG